ncbi:expansin EXLX1 family cellulose-binding protein [Phytohabitans sp. ZYX-F-186]|uniref:Expansin EXLX1 family cellulose-binding protein n=1 Tax=Phytohabitans maris TaxID=3071409 RepID=A0ABU0ZE58_9ACTN|nr:expansin EXLX1 family cellulose-binding protein [Phytohabitans sp. ZYX-F-186]MDQ7904719.1 expansin EXLX1 family cellulose-binding protein [Phytohabitans sp. ZYX-F-186]
MLVGRRWVLVGAAALLAAVTTAVLTLRSGPSPACAAPPTGSTVHRGKATFYDAKGEGGNCSYVSAPDDSLYVALGPSEYSAGVACGGYLDVTGPKGKVRVLIMDQCPECEAGHLDLSKEAFAKIANPVDGDVSISYKAAPNPTLPGPLSFRIKEGASRYWFAVLVADHGNPLRSVEVRSGSTWRATQRAEYNYWIYESGLGPGPYTIRLTDVYGQRATATGIKMAPEQVQKTSVRLYGAGAAAPKASASTKASTSPAAKPKASPRPTTAPPALAPAAAVADEQMGAAASC